MENKSVCKAAFSEVNITPDYQVELIGCYREDNRSKGVLHPLYAQILLFQNDRDYFCIITIDSLGLTTQLANDLRQRVSAVLGIDIQKIMLCFSHTHSAPAPTSFALNGEMYFRDMCGKIVQCVEQAKAGLALCKVGWSLTETDIGENRREGCTLVDRRLGALKVIDAATEKPIAILLRITAHANVLMSENNLISSDYFGVAREKLKDCFSCPVLLVQGAAGNIKPIGTDKIHGGKLSDLDKVTNNLVCSAKKLHFKMQEINDIQMVSKEITFYSGVPNELEAEQIAIDGIKKCGIDGADWVSECAKLRNEKVSEQTQKIELQLFKLNNGCICGVADEIFCEISLDVQSKTQNSFVFMNGYTNGCSGYLPNKAEWKKGGYETLYSYLLYYKFHGHVMPYNEDTADRLADFTVETWNNLNNTVMEVQL